MKFHTRQLRRYAENPSDVAVFQDQRDFFKKNIKIYHCPTRAIYPHNFVLTLFYFLQCLIFVGSMHFCVRVSVVFERVYMYWQPFPFLLPFSHNLDLVRCVDVLGCLKSFNFAVFVIFLDIKHAL